MHRASAESSASGHPGRTPREEPYDPGGHSRECRAAGGADWAGWSTWTVVNRIHVFDGLSNRARGKIADRGFRVQRSSVAREGTRGTSDP
ncbi:hypothetical protein GCM10009573_03930 [Agromyces bracchium]